MENRYDKVMKNIEVTSEMRDRILNNISKLDLEKAPNKNKSASFPDYRKYLFIAASLVILLIGSVILRNVLNLPKEPPQQAIPDIVEYSSIEEMSEAIGFPVKEINNIPFKVEQVQYTAYWKELAQVQYTGKSNTAVLRMAAHDEEVSGDYNEYSSIKSLTVNGDSVTFKGNGGKYVLAIWQDGGYSYSVQFTKAISEQELLTTVQSVK